MIWRDGMIDATAAPARVSPAGGGVFTTAGCEAGRPMLWPRHMARLSASTEALQPALPPPALPDEQEMAAFLECCGLSGPARLRLSARPAEGGWQLIAEAFPVTECGPVQRPLALVSVQWPQVPEQIGHKCLARTEWERARDRARALGADDALLVDGQGNVLETTVANIWARFGAVLVTPPAPSHGLPGVMRAWILDRLRFDGLESRVAALSLDQLLEADELWVSNAVCGLRRVARVGRRSWERWSIVQRLASVSLPAPGWPRAGALSSGDGSAEGGSAAARVPSGEGGGT